MHKTTLVVLLIVLGLTFVSGTNAKTGKADVFAYDRNTAFDVKVESSKDADGVTIQDINYAVCPPRTGRMPAYIVAPTKKGQYAGVVFFHWLGEKKSNRTEFLEEATELAKQGTVSLLIQGFFPWSIAPTDGPTDRQRIVEQTIEVRRAFDLLLQQPGVDAKRVGYVGHDYGAMFGSIAAGVDRRAKAVVVMAALGNFSDWSLKYWPKSAAKGEDAYRQAVNDLDPQRHVAKAAPAALLFQFAKTDKYIPQEAAQQFFDAASKPKEIRWYDAKHDLEIEAARTDRDVWLTSQLGLGKAH